MPQDPSTAGPEGAAAAIASAKDALAKGSKLTQSAEGNSTSSFAPKTETAPETTKAPYHMAHTARKNSIKDLTGQAGGENTKPREDAMKALNPAQ
jgi:hypothetical protein